MSQNDFPPDFTPTKVIEDRIQEWSKHIDTNDNDRIDDDRIDDDRLDDNTIFEYQPSSHHLPSKHKKSKKTKKSHNKSLYVSNDISMITKLLNLLKSSWMQVSLLFILLFTILSINITLPLQFLSFTGIPLDKISILVISVLSTIFYILVTSYFG
jgi:hypothetical protein